MTAKAVSRDLDQSGADGASTSPGLVQSNLISEPDSFGLPEHMRLQHRNCVATVNRLERRQPGKLVEPAGGISSHLNRRLPHEVELYLSKMINRALYGISFLTAAHDGSPSRN
jgi:hypothetical protein